jgi:hypothetical protein
MAIWTPSSQFTPGSTKAGTVTTDLHEITGSFSITGSLLLNNAAVGGNMTDAEVETAYNNQVALVGQAEAEAGVVTTRRGWTAQRVGQAIAALGGGTTITRASITNTDTPYTVALNTELFVDTSGGAITVNLPAVATWTAGDTITVMVTDATNTLTLDGSGPETVQGYATKDITSLGAVTLRCDGTSLFYS